MYKSRQHVMKRKNTRAGFTDYKKSRVVWPLFAIPKNKKVPLAIIAEI